MNKKPITEQFDPSHQPLLRTFSNPSLKILFYPSAGFRIRNLLDLPFDVFCLVDKLPPSQEKWQSISDRYPYPTRSYLLTPKLKVIKQGNKWLIWFTCDNNVALEQISTVDIHIDCFVATNDGCREGGNYECVNELSWLDNVFSLFPKSGGVYITDHSPIINWKREMIRTQDTPDRNHSIKVGRWKLISKFIESRNDPQKLYISFHDAFQFDGPPPFSPFYSEFLSAWEVTLSTDQK